MLVMQGAGLTESDRKRGYSMQTSFAMRKTLEVDSVFN